MTVVSAKLPKELRLALAILAALLVIASPFAILAAFWWPSAIKVASLAALLAVTAYISSSRDVAAKIVIVFALVAALGVAVSTSVILSTLVIAACAGLSAYTSRWGLASAALMVPVLVPYLIHEPPLPLPNGDTGGAYYLSIAVVAAVAGLWAVAVLAFALRHRSVSPVPLSKVAVPDAILGAVLVALVCGAIAFVALTWFAASMWVWLLLTILLLTKPTQGLNLIQTRDRAIGTVAGAAVAGLIAASRVPGLVMGALALILVVAALTVMLSGKPYWLYASFLTPAVVLMDASATDGVELAFQRAVYTLVGAVVAVALAFVINLVVHWRRRLAGNTPVSPANGGSLGT